MALRIYSTATMFERYAWTSSMNAAVCPFVSSASDIYDSTLNSMALRIDTSASMMPFTPKQRKLSEVTFVCPLKKRLSAPTQMDFSFRHKSRTVSRV